MDTNSEDLSAAGNYCFGCGPGNPQGLHLQFTTLMAGDGSITSSATATLARTHQGPPGYVHGGIIATMLDEAMAKLNYPLGVTAMTRNLEVDYLRPAPIDMELTIVARHIRREGRKIFHSAQVLGHTGKVLAEAKGLFIVVDLSHLALKPSEPR